jgi:hypothetical protein
MCLIPLRAGPAETGFVKCFYSRDRVPWRPFISGEICKKQLANARRHKRSLYLLKTFIGSRFFELQQEGRK